MAGIDTALMWLRNGKRVRSMNWTPGEYLKTRDDNSGLNLYTALGLTSKNPTLDAQDLLAFDWHTVSDSEIVGHGSAETRTHEVIVREAVDESARNLGLVREDESSMILATIYLSAPMRGHPDENKELFVRWAHKFRLLGYEVWTPFDVAEEANKELVDRPSTINELLVADMDRISKVDAVVWIHENCVHSAGCKAERAFAEALAIPVFLDPGSFIVNDFGRSK